MEENIVVFKGSVNGLTIILKDEASFTAVLDQIEQKIATAGKFFKGASLKVKYRGRKLTQQEQDTIFQLKGSPGFIGVRYVQASWSVLKVIWW
jgi:septum site-determining protein MinC